MNHSKLLFIYLFLRIIDSYDKLCIPLILRCDKNNIRNLRYNLFKNNNIRDALYYDILQKDKIYILYTGKKSQLFVNKSKIKLKVCELTFTLNLYDTSPLESHYDLYLMPHYTIIIWDVQFNRLCPNYGILLYNMDYYSIFSCN